ncbi:hypothetical protein [Georgenia yuyongxinii]
MQRTPIAVGIVAVLLGPTTVLAGIALFLGQTAAGTWCTPSKLAVGQVPDGLAARTADGTPVHLDRVQLGHAATIIAVGSRTDGVGQDGLLVALIAALTESRLRMLANTTAYPDSAKLPHDGNGSDHDSLGLFQMRPAAGWGSVADLMDPAYQAAAFFGGPSGPNHGRPRGLLDIAGWEHLPKGAAAQAVEVSAYPDRYAGFEPVAHAILDALTQTSAAAQPAGPADVPATAAAHGAGRVPAPSRNMAAHFRVREAGKPLHRRLRATCRCRLRRRGGHPDPGSRGRARGLHRPHHRGRQLDPDRAHDQRRPGRY